MVDFILLLSEGITKMVLVTVCETCQWRCSTVVVALFCGLRGLLGLGSLDFAIDVQTCTCKIVVSRCVYVYIYMHIARTHVLCKPSRSHVIMSVSCCCCEFLKGRVHLVCE